MSGDLLVVLICTLIIVLFSILSVPSESDIRNAKSDNKIVLTNKDQKQKKANSEVIGYHYDNAFDYILSARSNFRFTKRPLTKSSGYYLKDSLTFTYWRDTCYILTNKNTGDQYGGETSSLYHRLIQHLLIPGGGSASVFKAFCAGCDFSLDVIPLAENRNFKSRYELERYLISKYQPSYNRTLGADENGEQIRY